MICMVCREKIPVASLDAQLREGDAQRGFVPAGGSVDDLPARIDQDVRRACVHVVGLEARIVGQHRGGSQFQAGLGEELGEAIVLVTAKAHDAVDDFAFAIEDIHCGDAVDLVRHA